MLLNELLSKPSKHIRTSNKDVQTTFDAEHRLQPVGKGIQSRAFLHEPTDSIVKHTKISQGQQDATYQFMRLALAHQNNPYFPKYHNVKAYKKDDIISQAISKMEQLRPLAFPDLEHWIELLGYTPPQDLRTKVLHYSKTINHKFKDPKWRAKIFQQVEDPQLKQALRLLEPLFRHYTPDMHFGNVMVRSDGHLVITDPIWMDTTEQADVT